MNELFCGIDLGTRSSAFCVITANSQVMARWSGKNERLLKELSKVAGKLRCVVEAAPLAEHICNEVEKLGAEIEIVDSRHTKGLLHGRKTDRIDAEVLAELARSGWYKVVYRKGGKARQQKTVVTGRDALVKVSTQLKNTIRGLLKVSGIVLPAGGEGKEFVNLVRSKLKLLPSEVRYTIEQLVEVWFDVYERQRRGYRRLLAAAKQDPITKRLMTVPGVGPATALSFVSAIANPTRFPDARKVAGYLGLAPRVHQSGELNYHGRITKRGDKLTRWLLIEAASVLLTRVRRNFGLRTWGLRLAEKKGLAKAKVAVARRLAGLLHTLWLKDENFSSAIE